MNKAMKTKWSERLENDGGEDDFRGNGLRRPLKGGDI